MQDQYIPRNEAIKRIKVALKEATGRPWSVTGGRGTAYGWLRITAPKSRRVGEWGRMDDDDCRILGSLFQSGPTGEWCNPDGYSVADDKNEWAVAVAETAAAQKSGGSR